MVTEYRLLNNTSDRTGEIVLRGSPEKLVERLVNDGGEISSIIDPTYIQDFLLTYRVFIDSPTFISNKLYEWFQQQQTSVTNSPSNSNQLKKSLPNCSRMDNESF